MYVGGVFLDVIADLLLNNIAQGYVHVCVNMNK